MDKALIGLGVVMLFIAYNDTQDKYVDYAKSVSTQPGFIGSMVIMAGLLAVVQYEPKYAYIPSALAAIIALSYFTKFKGKDQ